MGLSRINTNLKIFLLTLPLLVWTFSQEWQDYFHLWTTSYIYNHGFLVFAGTLYLLFQRRENLSRLRLTSSWRYVAIFCILILIFLLAHSANIKLIRLVLLPLLLIAWGASLWGKPFIRIAGPPILLMLFGAPFWDEMSPALQWLTVAVDERLLALISIPATINEFYITIPAGTFFVDNGCSGIRYLLVALYLGTFYACLTDSSSTRTALLVVIAGSLALLSNWIRVVWIIAAGHYTNMQSPLIADHEMFGWIVFVAVTLIPFFLITHYLEKISKRERASTRIEKDSSNPTQIRKIILVATLPLIAIPTLLLLQNQAAEHKAGTWRPTLPEPLGEDWKGPIRYAGFWNSQYEGADIHLSGIYINEKHDQIQLDFYGYNRQTQGKELVYYRNSIFDPSEWHPVTTTNVPTSLSNPGAPKTVNELVLSNKTKDDKAVAWYWYDVAGTLLTSTKEVQLVGGLKTLIGDHRAAIWILATKCIDKDLANCQAQAKDRFLSYLMKIRF